MEEKEVVLSLPLRVPVSKKKYFSLNMNQYRNTHFGVLNTAKRVFEDTVRAKVMSLPEFERVGITYVFYPRTRRRCDLSNVCSVVDKFFCDALVIYGKLKDDSTTEVPEIEYRFGGIDSSNPRVDVTIRELSHVNQGVK